MTDEGALEARYRLFSRLALASAIVLVVGLGIELGCHIANESRKAWTLLSDIFVFGGVGGEVLFAHFAGIAADRLLAKYRLRAAEAGERAADALRESARIKSAASWRTLTNAERVPLVAALKASGQPESVIFTVLANDPESMNFAGQISIPFKAAGWKVGYRFESYTHGIMTGVLLPEARENWPDGMKLVSQRVLEAFIAADLRFATGWPLEPYTSIRSNDHTTEPFAWVYVGPKPMPYL